MWAPHSNHLPRRSSLSRAHSLPCCSTVLLTSGALLLYRRPSTLARLPSRERNWATHVPPPPAAPLHGSASRLHPTVRCPSQRRPPLPSCASGALASAPRGATPPRLEHSEDVGAGPLTGSCGPACQEATAVCALGGDDGTSLSHGHAIRSSERPHMPAARARLTAPRRRLGRPPHPRSASPPHGPPAARAFHPLCHPAAARALHPLCWRPRQTSAWDWIG